MLLQLSHFFPFAPLYPVHLFFHNQSPHHCPCPWILPICSLTNSFTFQLVPTSSPLLLQLSVCSMILCLWFYLAQQFVLFIIALISEDIWYLSFADWLISLGIIVSSSIHAVAKVGVPSFFLLCSIPLCKCITVVLFTHLLMDTQAVSSPWLL